MIKVAFYKKDRGTLGNGALADRLIRWWTRGIYSHTEIIVREENGLSLCWSAVPTQGVRSVWQEMPASDWDIIEVDADPVVVEKWFLDRNGAKYDFVGLMGFVARTGAYERNKYFCSECSASSLGIAQGWRYSPNSLKPIIDNLSLYKRK